ncbi:hypothetical protein [Planctobacterium marinum]|uniref:hypothetical protein n=1 Tax=Planctobacterium marinum TaxID=1631968 RepID=UPI001E2F46F1|nr:hypothetical protein [Planctobacterium marinum]MCC2607741.1 hypothetical protein [Planctobacterium marinum]
MQNMEKYYGFKVKLTDKLDPVGFELIQSSVGANLASSGIDINDFYAYFHQMIIFPNESHFGFDGGLERRVSKITLEFNVNKRQRENGQIKFFNFVYKPNEEHRVVPYYSTDTVGYIIPADIFSNAHHFQNSLVVFIHKSLRRTEYKKIKASISASPTAEFEPFVVNKANVKSVTELDVKFRKQIQLHLPFDDQYEELKMKDTPTTNIFNIQNAGAVGPNAKAENFTNNSSELVNSELVRELIFLLKDAQYDIDFPSSDNNLISNAIEAANSGNEGSLRDNLSKVSRWTLDKAEKIGVAVAAGAIKAYSGF